MISATITYIKASADWRLVPNSEYDFYYETVSINEATAIVLTKPLGDSYQFTDIAIVHLTKPLSHSISFADSLARTVAYSRQFTDGFALDDTAQVDKSINANKGNLAQVTDVFGFEFSRPLADTMNGLTDAFGFEFSRPLADIINGFTDVLINSFNKTETDALSFSDAVSRTIAKGISHSINIAEATELSHSKVLTDAFALDSATLVNKNYTSTKGNVFSFSDQIVISRTHGKALGNMMLGNITFN
tara:strand:+ start:762 stop:1499 length:738 start_codon:yes stop_codon:yes gene_type:complete